PATASSSRRSGSSRREGASDAPTLRSSLPGGAARHAGPRPPTRRDRCAPAGGRRDRPCVGGHHQRTSPRVSRQPGKSRAIAIPPAGPRPGRRKERGSIGAVAVHFGGERLLLSGEGAPGCLRAARRGGAGTGSEVVLAIRGEDE